MADTRTNEYARRLAQLIRVKTVSAGGQTDKSYFYALQSLLRKMLPNIFAACDFEDFDGSFLMRWKGKNSDAPILLMNHQDVVEAPGAWTHPPFAGEIADGKLWGRGTLDTKGGLWAMLQAADELAQQDFVPGRDIYFMSTCDEECAGTGAQRISAELMRRGVRLAMVLDEGGMIVQEPISGARGSFAMIGVGEKGCVDLKFTARSAGGHASTPGKNTPLVRLGKFMAAAERGSPFKSELSDTVAEMFGRISASMSGGMKFILGHARALRPLLVKVMPSVSPAAGAMLRTTVAFTMASGSQGANVLPQEAWVVGNMRYSHHQGGEDSIAAIAKLAAKYDIETQVISPGFDSPITDHRSEAFQFIERAVSAVFPQVTTSPYIMTGASDSRFMSRVCDNCLRFAPFSISSIQLDSIHGIDENVDLSALTPAVDFYRYVITEA